MASQQITKRLICLWKGCDEVFEEAADFKAHVDKHIQEQMQTALDNRGKDGTEEQQEDEPLLAKKAKLNEDNKLANGVDIGRRKIVFPAVEVWTDIFGFVKRIQLARISLTNRHIHQICWPRLHGNKVEPYEITDTINFVGQERFNQDRPPKARVMIYHTHKEKAMPMPSCPLPSYITGFHCIRIKFLDQQVLAFFTYILPCLAKTGVRFTLGFDGSDAKQCALLDQLLNIFRDGLPENKLHGFYCLMTDLQYLPDIDNKLPIIDPIIMESGIPILLKMLASPRHDGRQRVIGVSSSWFDVSFLEMLIIAIKEDFRSSTKRLPQPFYICFERSRVHLDLEETNEQTDEQLTIMTMPTTDDNIIAQTEICRHPRGQHEQWAEDGRKRFYSAWSYSSFLTVIEVGLSRDNA